MMWGKTWRVAFLAVACLALGIGLGVAWARRSQTVAEAPPGAPPPPGPSAAIAPPTGTRIEARQDVENLFGAVAQTAAVLKFSGTDSLKFRVEVERAGQAREVVLELTSSPILGNGASANREGDVVWLRIKEADAPGRETWRMTVQSNNHASFTVRLVDLFLKKDRTAPKLIRPLPAVTQIEAPSPLPHGRAVCLKEYRELADRGEQVATAVSLWGALAFPSVGPFPACVLGGAGWTDEICTIRLMCEVIPDQGK